MATATCAVVRWIRDEPQPGWVEANLIDAEGRTWQFFDKPPIFSAEPIDADSDFPVAGKLRCRVLGEHPSPTGKARVEIETTDLASTDERRRFVLDASRVDPD